jgi:hypothetical protein
MPKIRNGPTHFFKGRVVVDRNIAYKKAGELDLFLSIASIWQRRK